MCGLDLTDSGLGRTAGFYGHDNEPSGSIKLSKFLDYLSALQG